MTAMPDDFPPNLKEAEALSLDRKFLAAFNWATGDEALWRRAKANPQKFLRSQKVRVSPNLQVYFRNRTGRYKQGLEANLFVIRQFRSRTYWRTVHRPGQAPRIERISHCFGFEIVPKISL